MAKKAAGPRDTRHVQHARELIAQVDELAERLRPSRRPADRNATQCSAQELFALNTIGRRERLTMTDLAATLRVPLSTVSRVVDRLVDKGLVVRTPLAHDRRVVHVGFSPRGRRIDQFVAGSRHAAAVKLLGRLSDRDAVLLLTALARMLED